MILHISDILLDTIDFTHYNNTSNVKQMIIYLNNGGILPDIIVYKEKKNGKWILADGIHRICAYLQLDIKQIHYNH